MTLFTEYAQALSMHLPLSVYQCIKEVCQHKTDFLDILRHNNRNQQQFLNEVHTANGMLFDKIIKSKWQFIINTFNSN